MAGQNDDKEEMIFQVQTESSLELDWISEKTAATSLQKESDTSYIYLFTQSFIHLFIQFPRYQSLVFGCRYQTGSSPLPVMKALRNHRYIFHI